MVFALYCLYILQSRIEKIRFRINKGTLKQCFMQAMPIGLSEIAFAATFYSATLTLGYLVGGKSVGWFGAAHRILMAIHTFVWLYFYNLLPSISRCDGQPAVVLQNLLCKSISITSWAGVFLGLSGTILAEPIITTVYGSGYIEAVNTFKVLIWIAVVMLLNGHFSYTLIGYNFQRLLLICYGVSAFVCVILSISLIPKFEQLGAAIALLCATMVNGGLAYSFVFRNIGRISIIYFFIKPVLSGIVTSSILLFLSPSNLLLSCALLLGLYFLSFLALQPKFLKNFLLLITKNR
jgi:O-antigen/teichoic acid export membrane protein